MVPVPQHTSRSSARPSALIQSPASAYNTAAAPLFTYRSVEVQVEVQVGGGDEWGLVYVLHGVGLYTGMLLCVDLCTILT